MAPATWIERSNLMWHRIMAVGICMVFVGTSPMRAQDPEVLTIGFVDSMVQNLSPARKKLLDSEFPDLVKEVTGFKSQVAKGGSPFDGAKSLAAGKWHMGVFQGVEFAWAQSKDPKLQPLMFAVQNKGAVYALLVAKKESTAAGFPDLKGKDVAFQEAKVHCRLFAEKNAGGDPKTFFGKLANASGGQAALDDILLDKVQAAIVDSDSMATYKDIQPGRFKRLKVLAKSEPFPPTVLAYYQGGLSDRVLNQFRDGMLKADKTRSSRDAMAEAGISAFEPVTEEYRQLLTSIVKAYPPPAK